MPFVIRDEHGVIQRISARALAVGEMLPHSHPDVVEFLTSHHQDPKHVEETLNELRASDMDMTRAIEDVITVLLKKSLIKMSDLPRPVQDRMALRVKLRARIEDAYERASHTKNPTVT